MRNQKTKSNIIIFALIVACIGVGAMIIDNLKSSKEASDIVDEIQSKDSDIQIDIEQPKEDETTGKDMYIEDKTVEEPKPEPIEESVKNAEKDVKEDDTIESQEIKEAMQQQEIKSTDKQPIKQQEPSEIEKEDTKQEQANIQPEEPKPEPVKEKPKTDPKPELSNNDNLVPDSENPFKQPLKPLAPNSGLKKDAKGSEYYQDGVPAGEGDKF